MDELLDHRRHLTMEGARNIRDLGGYTTASGAPTRWQRFLRADNQAHLTEADQARLLDYGLTTAVDLRLTHEVVETPNVFTNNPSVAFHHLNFLGDEDRGYEAAPPAVDAPERMAHTYRNFLEGCKDNVALIMSTLAASGGTALFHCHAGKDRTGLVAAFLLGLAGVPAATIAADYGLTAKYLFDPESGDLNVQSEEAYRNSSCPPGTLSLILEYLNADYGEQGQGGVEGYMRAVGLSDEQIAALRSRLLD